MSVEDLIQRLAAETRPRVSVPRSALMALVPALLATLGLLAVRWGFRADLASALSSPMPAIKVVLPTLVALTALWGALRLARPEGEARAALAILGILAAVALGLIALGLTLTPREAWGEALRGHTLLACLRSIPTLALLPTLGLMLALRRGASITPRLSGLLVGLAAGAAAAAIYALHCPQDNPLFFVTWYGTGILLVTGAGALIGSRTLRW